jgi:DNA helicase-2/ATP-dependent DNA helicase PcrA
LRKRNIPYRIYGGLSFYQRKEIKDAIAYFRLTINPNDDEALRRIINYPARGIGDTTVGKIQQAASQSNRSMWSVVTNPIASGLSVNSGTLKKLQGFVSMINSFIEKNESGENAYEVAQMVLRDTSILASVSSDKTPENISKKENLDELLNGINDFVETKREVGNLLESSMSHFLAEVSLSTDQDENKDDKTESVTLMTVHAAKGLEFKNVIIVGVEEELFPSMMSSDSLAGIEEERRLLYVAITRAKVNCTMTYASSRYRNGQTKSCQMSRFIRDIDDKYLSMSQASSSSGGYSSPSRHSFWDNDGYSSAPIYSREKKTTTTSKVQKSNTQVQYTPRLSNNEEKMSPDFTIHEAHELAEGMMIQHFRFGEGVVENIDSSGADSKIRVHFIELNETKLLMLRFAKFKILD